MSSIPANLSRVPNLLVSRSALGNLTRTNIALFRVQTQIATGRAVNRFSDDAVRAAAIGVLDDRLERAAQRTRNLQHADSSLTTLDQALGEASDLILDAKEIASTQVNLGSTPAERASQALVVGSLIQSLLTIVNREGVAGAIFGASTPGTAPVQELLGAFRYAAQGGGLLTDLGELESVPITMGPNALGATSARVIGDVDLDPVLTGDVRLSEVAGARGLGVALGEIEFSFDGGPRTRIDLSGAETAQDVADAITVALQDYEAASTVTILGPGGVGFDGGSLSIDVAAAATGPDPDLRFFDVGAGVAAQDLGLAGQPAVTFTATSANGLDTAPRLTLRSPIADMAGLTGPLGAIRVKNLGQTRVIDLSTAVTLGDLKNLIDGAGLALRLEINEDGAGINIVNEAAGGQAQAMAIEEVSGEGLTATRLGIRSLTTSTRLTDFNDGRGVRLVHGSVNPVTGSPDPSLDVDFAITLGDSGGTEITVDLRPQDLLSVQTVIDRINAEAAGQGVNVPADFEAVLGDGANGIELRQNQTFPSALTVERRNNSAAPEDLGLLDGTFDLPTGTFRAADRATVRVDSLFTALVDLRDALAENDTSGITLAGEKFEAFVDRLAQGRALVGSYAARVESSTRRLEDQTVLDEATRSGLRDLDYTEAAVRLSMLQTQLQAGLTVTAISSSMTLLDFLG